MEFLACLLSGNLQKNVWWRNLTVFLLGIATLAASVVLTHYLGLITLALLWYAVISGDIFPFTEQVFLVHFVIQPSLLILNALRTRSSDSPCTNTSRLLQILIPGGFVTLSEVYWFFGMMIDDVYRRSADLPMTNWQFSLTFFAILSAGLTLFYCTLLDDVQSQSCPKPDPA